MADAPADDGSDILDTMAATAAAPSGGAPASDDGSDILDTMAATQNAKDATPSAPPPPTRHLGPPRLHAQQHQPRPPPSAPGGGAPSAAPLPPAPSWGQVPGLFAQHIIPDTGRMIGQTLETLKPSNWGKDASALNDLAVGALSKAGIYGGSAAQKAQDQATLNALIAAKKQQWWGKNGEGLRRSLAYTPAENLMDVATAATLVGAPAELVARAPGLVGEATAGAAGTVARAARGVEGVTNPLSYPIKAATAAVRAPGAAVRALTGASRGAGSAAGTASAAETALRAVHPSEPIPTEMLTGEEAPPEAATKVTQSRANWRGHAADQATQLAGGNAPDPAALGNALEDRLIATHNAAIDNYGTVGALPGQFAPAFAPTLRGAVDTAFNEAQLPPITGPGNISTLPGSYGKTLDAMNAMHTQVDDLAANNALTPSNLMRVRQEIGTAYKGASGADMKGLRTLQEALDNHIANMTGADAYIGGDGAAVTSGMRNAIDGWRNYQDTITKNPTAAKAFQLLRKNMDTDAAGKLEPSAAGTPEAVTAQLGKGLINSNLSTPGGASLLYNHLSDFLGGPGSEGATALDNYVRQSVARTKPLGEGSVLAAKPEQIHGFLGSSPLGDSVFSPEEQTQLGNIAETDRLAQQRPSRAARASSFLGSLIARGSRHGVGALAGSHFGPVGAILGEQMVGRVVDPMLAARTAARAFKQPAKGAPGAPSFLNPRTVATAANLGWQATPQSPEEQQQEAVQNDQDIVTAAPPVADVAKGADMGKGPAATPTDVDAAVRMAAAEGDPTPEGWQAVAAVMRNRSLQSGKSLADVAAEPRQFEAYGNRNYMGVRPGTAAYTRILSAIAPVLAGKADPTGGADSYYSPAVQAKLGRRMPSWDDGSGQMIGTQRFFHGKYRRPVELAQAHAGGRVGFAVGGEVGDMTDRLMQRAEHVQKAIRSSTKPLLHLSDDTVAKALRVASAGF